MECTTYDDKKSNLSDEELVELYIKHNESDYINILYTRMLPFVKYMCRKLFSEYMTTHNVEFDDIVSLSSFSFMKAVKYYDATKGFRFSTYLGKCLYRDITNNLDYYNRKNKEVHLDEIVVTEKRDGSTCTLTDMLPDTSINFADDVIEQNYNTYIKEIIDKAYNRLNSKDKELFELYYLKNKSQSDIASIYNYSQPTISNEIIKVREKFKILLKNYNDLPEFVYKKDTSIKQSTSMKDKLPKSYKEHLECLSEREKEIILLHFEDNMKYSDITEKTGTSKRGICQIVKRSIKKLEAAERGIIITSRKRSNESKLPSNFKNYIHYLKEKDQEVIRLRYVDKLCYKDIAVRFNTNVGNVGNIVRTATNKLIYYIYKFKE